MAPAVVTGVAVVPSAHAAGDGAGRFDPQRAQLVLRPARLLRMDPMSALALLAADGALVDAGLDAAALAALEGDRFGVALGTARGCHVVNAEFFAGVLAGGPLGASPRQFVYTLPSSPLGEVTLHFRARGPVQTLASGASAGLEALGRAADLCAQGRARAVLALGIDYDGPDSRGGAAVAFLVENSDAARGAGRRPRAVIAGSGCAFDSDPAAARARSIEAAFAAAGLPQRALAPLVVGDGAGAPAPLLALAGWMASGHREGSPALVVSADAASVACALLVVAA